MSRRPGCWNTFRTNASFLLKRPAFRCGRVRYARTQRIRQRTTFRNRVHWLAVIEPLLIFRHFVRVIKHANVKNKYCKYTFPTMRWYARGVANFYEYVYTRTQRDNINYNIDFNTGLFCFVFFHTTFRFCAAYSFCVEIDGIKYLWKLNFRIYERYSIL